MFVFISIALMSLTALVMFVLRLTRRDFGYHWLIAVGGTLIAWVMVILAGTNLPAQVQLSSWDLQTAYPNLISFSVDQISWPFALGLGTLILVSLLTDVIRAYDLDWSNWTSSLLITSVGLMGVLSGNLLTFILAWMVFDLITVIILLLQLQSGKSRRQAVYVFFAHLLGSVSLLIAGVISINDNNSFLFERASPNAVIFVVLAAGFRLSLMPVDSILQENPVKRRSLGTVMSLVSAAIVVVFLVRVANALEGVNLMSTLWGVIFSLVGLVSLLFAMAWLMKKDELNGQHAWISGMGGLVLAAALHSQPNAGIAWGMAMLFSGGLIFLASVRDRFSLWITLLGLIGLSTLPFTPAWSGLLLFSSPLNIAMVFYLFVIVLLIWGYAQHATQISNEPSGLERWIRVVYPFGLVMMPVIHFVWGLLYRPAISEIPFTGWILGVGICVLAFLGFMWRRRGGYFPQNFANAINSFLELHWFYKILRILFDYGSRLIFFISSVLEGDGGILWMLLWIVIFLAILLISFGT
jgi:hypothetical protein